MTWIGLKTPQGLSFRIFRMVVHLKINICWQYETRHTWRLLKLLDINCLKNLQNMSFWVLRMDVHLKIENKLSIWNWTRVHDGYWSYLTWIGLKTSQDLSFRLFQMDVHLKTEKKTVNLKLDCQTWRLLTLLDMNWLKNFARSVILNFQNGRTIENWNWTVNLKLLWRRWRLRKLVDMNWLEKFAGFVISNFPNGRTLVNWV